MSVTLPRAIVAVSIPAVLAAGSTRAAAQIGGPQRPSNGVLFEKAGAATAGHKLDVTVSSSEGYEDVVSTEARIVGGSAVQPAGFTTLMTGTATYAWRGRHTQFTAADTSSLRYFRSTDEVLRSADPTGN